MAKTKKNINLLPKDELEKNPLGKLLKWSLNIGRYIVILTELIVVIAFLIRFKLDRNKAHLQEKMKNNQTIVLSFKQLESQIRFLQKRLKIVKSLENNNLAPSLVLDKLSAIMPFDMVLDELTIKKDTLTLKGYCLSNAGLSAFINNLEENKEFSQINLSKISSKGKNDPSLKFSLSAKISKINKD